MLTLKNKGLKKAGKGCPPAGLDNGMVRLGKFRYVLLAI